MSQVSAVIKEMIRQQLLTLHTCLVCKVLELYSDGTAKVQPCTMMQTAKGTVKQHVALDGVPILDQIRSTVSVGKACVVVFTERDISAVRYAEFALPSASRHHSLSDGIIIGTIDGSGTVIPGESSAPLPSETATAKTSTNKKTNGTEVQVDVKVSRQSGNKLQAKSDGLFVPESPDTNTTYNISKDGSTLKLTGSDGSESSVAIPESKNTTYRVSSGIFPSSHGVTLRGSDGSNSIAPLETYRRSLYLPDATAKNMERVTDRGYLYSTHGYAFTSTMSLYDSSHRFDMSGTYSKDDESFDFIIHGDISVGQGVPVITNLSIECNDPDNQLSVYAYNVFESAAEDHDYVYYYTWLAVYSKKDLSSWTCNLLSSIHYTDGEYIEPTTPPDSEHSVNYVKMEEQVVKTADENTKYELSKTGNTITLTGSDGTSSSVLDSYMTYELLTDYFPDGPTFLLQGQKYPTTTDSEITKSKLNVPYTYTAGRGNPIYRSGGDLAIDDDHYSIIDIEYGVFDDFIDSTTNVFDITIDVHFATSIGKYQSFFLSIRVTPGGSYAIIRCEDVQVAITKGVIIRKGSKYFSSRKLTAHVLRIGFSNVYKLDAIGLRDIEAKLKYQTSRTGALLTVCRAQGLLVESLDAILADETIPTFFDISATDVKDVAFTGDYNDLKHKLTAGTNITIDNNVYGNNIISAKDTTYASKAAVSGGTDVSLVTTGEKALWNAKTSNIGTITGIKMNGASKGTSGVVDLGTVVTAHQDISGKQDKSTAVTHSANTAVGSATKPVYIAANGSATPISHSINADVPANAKFTDTTYSDATTSKPGLMSAADKTNLNANTLARHTHSNKATLDKLTDAQLAKLDGIDPDLYLPKAGGVMTGDIDMKANKRDILVGTHKANTSSGTPIACGTIDTDKKFDEMLPTMRSYIGTYHYKTSSAETWYDMISVRHRNGHSDGSNWGMYIYAKLFGGNLQWNLNTNKNTWQGERTLLDSINFDSYAAKSNHTHAMITNSALWVSGADNTAKWARLGTLVSSGNFSNAVIRVWSGDGANGRANQNSSFEIQIKDGWQSTLSANKACGVTVYRISCSNVKVKVIPTAHDTYTVWAYLPWGYWNGNYAVYGKYKSWTSQHLIQSEEPEGTGADTAYYDQAFLTSTVAKATEATALAETAWTAGAAETVGRSIKYLKSGNTVFVQGSISFSASLNTPVCGKMPSDCLPNQKLVFTGWDIIGAPASFAIILDTDGKLSFLSPGTTAYWFKDHRAYSFNFSYHIG